MKKPIVFDSSTIILLSKVSLLKLIADGAKCIITSAVKDECTTKDTYDSAIIKELIKENLIEVRKTRPRGLKKLMKDFNIQEGEASSLALVLKGIPLLATDDKPTIKACIILNIDFSTAIHFLIRAYEKGMIDKEMASEKLSALERYGRYSPRIIEDARKRIGRE